MLVPTTRSMGMWCCSRYSMTPICAKPSAPPPSSTSAMRGWCLPGPAAAPVGPPVCSAGFCCAGAPGVGPCCSTGGCVCPQATVASNRGTTDNRTVLLMDRFHNMPEPPTKTARSVYTSILAHAHTLVVDCQSTCETAMRQPCRPIDKRAVILTLSETKGKDLLFLLLTRMTTRRYSLRYFF